MASHDIRRYTNKLLNLIAEGQLDRDEVINALTSYMSEDDVKDCCISNEFFDLDDDNEDEQ